MNINYYESLNPCYSGRWFVIHLTFQDKEELVCLNPCYSGRWFVIVVFVFD